MEDLVTEMTDYQCTTSTAWTATENANWKMFDGSLLGIYTPIEMLHAKARPSPSHIDRVHVAITQTVCT